MEKWNYLRKKKTNEFLMSNPYLRHKLLQRNAYVDKH